MCPVTYNIRQIPSGVSFQAFGQNEQRVGFVISDPGSNGITYTITTSAGVSITRPCLTPTTDRFNWCDNPDLVGGSLSFRHTVGVPVYVSWIEITGDVCELREYPECMPCDAKFNISKTPVGGGSAINKLLGNRESRRVLIIFPPPSTTFLGWADSQVASSPVVNGFNFSTLSLLMFGRRKYGDLVTQPVYAGYVAPLPGDPFVITEVYD